jgi:Ala-tRNA(Pro) deacylase
MASQTRPGPEQLLRFLDEHDIGHDVIAHEPTERAAEEATATHRPAEQVAKSVILVTEDGYAFAVVPASHRLDLRKAAEALERGRHSVRFASEDEIAADFPDYDVGAIPPLGPRTPVELLDRRLLDYSHVVCAGGDHQHSLVLDPQDIVQATGAHVLDICED